MNFAARNKGYLRIEQGGQRPQNAALGLSAQPEQNEVMPRKNRVHDLRNDGIVVADNTREDRSGVWIVTLLVQTGDEVLVISFFT